MSDYALFIIGALVVYICTELKGIKEDLEWIKSHIYNIEHKDEKDLNL
jgi:hypothetical protein